MISMFFLHNYCSSSKIKTLSFSGYNKLLLHIYKFNISLSLEEAKLFSLAVRVGAILLSFHLS